MQRAIRCLVQQLRHRRALRIEQGGKRGAKRDACRAAERHEAVECRAGGRFRRIARGAGEYLRRAARGEIEDRVPDGDPAARAAARWAEHAEGQVLDREIGMSVGGGDPAPLFGVVRRVGHHASSCGGKRASAASRAMRIASCTTSSAPTWFASSSTSCASSKREASGVEIVMRGDQRGVERVRVGEARRRVERHHISLGERRRG